jgi:hypothetical protein
VLASEGGRSVHAYGRDTHNTQWSIEIREPTSSSVGPRVDWNHGDQEVVNLRIEELEPYIAPDNFPSKGIIVTVLKNRKMRPTVS